MESNLANKLKIQSLVAEAQARALLRVAEAKQSALLKVQAKGEELIRDKEAINDYAETSPFIPAMETVTAEVHLEELKRMEPIPRPDTEFQWNEEQTKAIALAAGREDFCLVGAAGTGKTTTEIAILKQLIHSGFCPILKRETKRFKQGQYAFAVVSFTRRAVQAAKRQLSADMRLNCMTIHKFLEYEPVFFDVLDPQTGMMKKTMRFEPQRTAHNPYSEFTDILIDESSMCDTDLYAKLKAACPNARFIFVGDIQQLPPIYGSAILGYKMLECPVIELTQVYRQALKSPIIRLAHRILSGKPIAPADIPEVEEKPELVFHLFKKRVEAERCIVYVKKFFSSLCIEGKFNPDTDVILCPFNEAFGTLELNRAIAQTLGEMRKAPVFEVISGFMKHYYAVGDRVLVDKQDGIIKEIVTNGMYVGKRPHKPSLKMNRYGNYTASVTAEELEGEKLDEEDLERMLELAESKENEERKNQASHIIKIVPVVNGEEMENYTWDLSTAGEINSMLFSYALTVHKSQGSEWERVYFIMHHSHNTMCQREMLYTAVTRAKKYLYIICEGRSQEGKEDSTFEQGIRNQRIKGNTLKEKAEFFKGKKESQLV